MFFIASEFSSPFSLIFSKLNFDNKSITWIKSVAWPNASCGASYGGAVFLSTENLIYSSTAYDSRLLFLVFNQNDGSIYSNRYKSSLTWNSANSLKKHNEVFYMYALCLSHATIVAYDRSTDNFALYSFTLGIQLFGTIVELNSDRYSLN